MRECRIDTTESSKRAIPLRLGICGGTRYGYLTEEMESVPWKIAGNSTALSLPALDLAKGHVSSRFAKYLLRLDHHGMYIKQCDKQLFTESHTTVMIAQNVQLEPGVNGVLQRVADVGGMQSVHGLCPVCTTTLNSSSSKKADTHRLRTHALWLTADMRCRAEKPFVPDFVQRRIHATSHSSGLFAAPVNEHGPKSGVEYLLADFCQTPSRTAPPPPPTMGPGLAPFAPWLVIRANLRLRTWSNRGGVFVP